jgi:NitT/TauT family transport system substrate-binding protein
MRSSAARSAILAILVSALVAAACGQAVGNTSPSGSTASPAGSESGGSVRIGVFPNVTHAPGLIALAKGGPLSVLLPATDIQVMSFNSGSAAVEAMFSDAVDVTYVGPNPAINAYAQSDGKAVRIISGSTSGGAFLVVRPGIATAADLKGRKLASPSLGNTQDVALRAWVKANGLTTDNAGGGDVSIVPQDNGQSLETFQAGTIDGAWVPEPWATRLVTEGGGKVLVDERDLWPGGRYVTTHLMVATAFLEAHADIVQRILLANIKAVDAIAADPEAAQRTVNDEIESFTTKKIGTDVLKAAWGNLTFTVDPIASSLQKSADDAVALGLLKDPGDLTGLYDLTLLNGVLRDLGRPTVTGPE